MSTLVFVDSLAISNLRNSNYSRIVEMILEAQRLYEHGDMVIEFQSEKAALEYVEAQQNLSCAHWAPNQTLKNRAENAVIIDESLSVIANADFRKIDTLDWS